MSYVLGIDGGGTSTVCLLADGEGRVIARADDDAVASSVREEVLDLTSRFPLYKSLPSMMGTT